MAKKGIKYALILVAFLALLIIQPFTYENIDAGNVGFCVQSINFGYEKNASIQARLKAENQAKQADAEAKVKVATATGEAQALLVRAKSETEANRLRQSSLTPMLIQQEWIKKWDGKLPTRQAGGNTSFMMPIK